MTTTTQTNELSPLEACVPVGSAALSRSGIAQAFQTEGATRFTLDGSNDLEAHLSKTCARVFEGVRAIIPAAKLEAILLGGGYGRGEGGVLRTRSGDRAYNDLEFYVFIRGNAVLNERRYRHALPELGERLSPDAGLEVEFKAMTFAKLRRSPVNMFYYDLVRGHRWLLGNESLLRGCEHHRDAACIPLAEATRLLMNRCSGLLFAEERLQRAPFTPDDADFVARNHAKARLAFGDVLLAAHGRYHWSCLERHQRLIHFAAPGLPKRTAAIIAMHVDGLKFKLHPEHSTTSLQALRAEQAELVAAGDDLWRWVEALRLHGKFKSARDYAFSSPNKCPESSRLRNLVVNLRAFGAQGVQSPSRLLYPRTRLLNALALLLWEPVLRDATLLARVQGELNTDATTFPGLVRVYQNLWRRFN